MTTTLVAPAATETASGPPRAWRSLLPWILPAVAALGALLGTGTPARDIAVYGGYFLLAIVVPGTLVLRAFFGSRGNWPEDLALGTATGLVVMLAGWALGAALSLQSLLIGWPVLVVLPFLLVPRLRRCWRRGAGEPLPLGWHGAMAAVLLLVILWLATVFQNFPLPPVRFEYYKDLYYHLALVHEMTRSMPFQVPQLAGYELRYHYLSDADLATAHMVTGIAPTTLLFRLWLLAITVAGVFAFATLARVVSGRWWAAPVAAAAGFAGQAVSFGSAAATFNSGGPVTLLSPSQDLAMPLIALFAVLAVDRLRGRPLGWGWAFLPVLAVANAGAKASVLPPLAAGLALAAVVSLWRRRTTPWAAAGLFGVTAFGMLFGATFFAGGGASVLQPQPLGTLRWMAPYTETLGVHDGPRWGGLVPPGIQDAGTTGRLFVAWVVIWALLLQAPRLIGLVLPPRTRGTGDPALPLIAGVLIAGTAATWVFWHPTASQIYFFAGVIPFGAVLAAWSLADRARSWRVPVAGAVAGALCAVLLPDVGPPAGKTVGDWAWTLAVPLLRLAAITAVVVAVVLAVRRGRARRALPVALIAATLGAGVATCTAHNVDAVLDTSVAKGEPRYQVTALEMRAARWLDRNAGANDLVATNVHCRPISAGQPCDARAFWVAGLGGRRTLVESWGYSDQALARNGTNNLNYVYAPPPDRNVYALNQKAFTTGDPAVVARLRDEYGVRWLFADSRAGKVAPELAAVATERLRLGTVTIYELGR
ncbi:hypothetical protein BJY16_002069 [Actinoplanes octamycinicus]|uniref:4-amino-4-deoxy-L-arabinose transferase-like glycosyltransferase n=1 Tax=Actinoplanes octamycinicus TaxID=135948 RepID=A0A7W7GUN3_9ACTN|nr:hypothetical protein [Actinoplanes octamycinicus]MBB4738610.1 hypothetical protein [Actinoplanes octamycinicus]GIE57736.1 hypothetical protein Aoc01nite_31380 [Actinoplanes octamycinicus]